MEYTRVGEVYLPELPDGWDVAVDTEGSALHVDGTPFQSGAQPPAPPARISAVSVSFRQPLVNGVNVHVEGELAGALIPGEIVDYAWPFDQGPVIGKPGKPIKDPETAIHTFEPIDAAEQRRILEAQSKLAGYVITPEMACPNLDVGEYATLIAWLDRRDSLIMHNSVHDMHTFNAGLREGAGGDVLVPDGHLAWDPDSEPGTWRPLTPQEVGLMEPSVKKLITPGQRRRRIWCTLVTQKQLVDPLEVGALKPTARRLWGEDETEEAEALAKELSKIGVKMTKRYDLLPWCGAMGRYAAKDTNLTFRLKEYQNEAVEQGAVIPDFHRLHDDEMELRTTLYRMENLGVAYDTEASFAEGRRVRELARRIAESIPFDASKPNSAKRFYFGPDCDEWAVDGRLSADKFEFHDKDCPKCEGKNGLGLKPSNRTPTGLPQLNIEEVQRLAAEGAPFAAEYFKYTKLRNSDSKWYTGWAARTGPDGRLRTQFKQTKNDRERPGGAEGGTKSGRLAVGRWQAQAIPHGRLIPEGAKPVRELIGRTPGKAVYETDLPSGEVRVVTVIAHSTKMWDALDAGIDLHGMNTENVFGVTPDDPDFYDLRSGMKRGTFGFLYGGGLMSVKEQVEAAAGRKMTLAAIKQMRDRFFEEYPEFQIMGAQAERKVTRYLGGVGYLEMLDGWRRWYALNEKTNSAVNQVIQGNLARSVNRWMTAVDREIPGCLLLQIHDSLVTEHADSPAGEQEARDVARIGQEVMEDYFCIKKRGGRIMHFPLVAERWDAKH